MEHDYERNTIKKWDDYPCPNQARPVLFSMQRVSIIENLLDYFPTVYDFILIDGTMKPENMQTGKIYLSIENRSYWMLDCNQQLIQSTFGHDIDFSAWHKKINRSPGQSFEFNTDSWTIFIRKALINKINIDTKGKLRVKLNSQFNKYISTSAIWSGMPDFCTPTSHFNITEHGGISIGIVLNPEQLRLGQADFYALNSMTWFWTEVRRDAFHTLHYKFKGSNRLQSVSDKLSKYPNKVVYQRDEIHPVTHQGLSEKVPNDQGGYNLILHPTPSFDVFFKNVWRKYWKRNHTQYNEALVCQASRTNPIVGLMISDSQLNSLDELKRFCDVLEKNAHLKLYLYKRHSENNTPVDIMKYIDAHDTIKQFISRVRNCAEKNTIKNIFDEFYNKALSCLDLQQNALKAKESEDTNQNLRLDKEREYPSAAHHQRSWDSFLMEILQAIAGEIVRFIQNILNPPTIIPRF